MGKTQKHQGPGRADREGISLLKLMDLFPTEDSARQWFEDVRWAAGRYCGHCGSSQHSPRQASGKPMPYRCSDCRKYFSVRTGTPMQSSRLPLRKWVFAMYLMTTSLKGVSSMKLHRDLDITQKTAWYLAQRIRQSWDVAGLPMAGPVEVDESYFGGKEGNKHESKKRRAGRGPVGKAAVVGIKDRQHEPRRGGSRWPDTDKATLHGFVGQHAPQPAAVYTDEHGSYRGLPRHEAVNHSVGEYVRGAAHTQGIDSFWATLKRAHKGVFHHFSVKHLHRYITEFAGRHNVRDLDTIQQLTALAAGMTGKRLPYRELDSLQCSLAGA